MLPPPARKESIVLPDLDDLCGVSCVIGLLERYQLLSVEWRLVLTHVAG